MRILTFTLRLGAALLLAFTAITASAQNFPNATIKLVVGTPPGGTTDIMARLVALKVGDLLGQPVVVENKSGAGGLIAAEGVAKAPADGYTLLMAPAQLATCRALYPGTTLDPERE